MWKLALALCALVGCVAEDSLVHNESQNLATAPCTDIHLSWGTGDNSVGLAPPAFEFPGRSVDDLDVMPDGTLVLLDGENGRIVTLDGAELKTLVSPIPRDAEDLAVGPNGTIAVHSPLQAKVWWWDRDGTPLGEASIPRTIRDIVDIDLSLSHELHVITAFQERFRIGSPSALSRTVELLSSKKEGAYSLANGRGIQVKRDSQGRASLQIVDDTGPRTRIESEFTLAARANSIQAVGMSGNLACFRAETLRSEASMVRVDRRLLCANTSSGAIVRDEALPPVGLVVPKHEVAFRNGIAASLHPSDEGLTIKRCEVKQ
jgi:hypothetical protein